MSCCVLWCHISKARRLLIHRCYHYQREDTPRSPANIRKGRFSLCEERVVIFCMKCYLKVRKPVMWTARNYNSRPPSPQCIAFISHDQPFPHTSLRTSFSTIQSVVFSCSWGSQSPSTAHPWLSTYRRQQEHGRNFILLAGFEFSVSLFERSKPCVIWTARSPLPVIDASAVILNGLLFHHFALKRWCGVVNVKYWNLTHSVLDGFLASLKFVLKWARKWKKRKLFSLYYYRLYFFLSEGNVESLPTCQTLWRTEGGMFVCVKLASIHFDVSHSHCVTKNIRS
jgi:hypothetical protein